MKKIFLKTTIIFSVLFLFSFVYTNKIEAAVTTSISASKTSASVGDIVTISWSSSGADSCTNNFNSSTATSGSYFYTASSSGSQTFSVTCKKVWATKTSCFGGVYEYPDPDHPRGGSVSYTSANGTDLTELDIYKDSAVNIEYRVGTLSVTGAGINAGACRN